MNTDAWEDILTTKGLSKTQASARCGLPRATLASLAGGFHKASLPVVKQIADGLGVNPATLFPTVHPRFRFVEDAELQVAS